MQREYLAESFRVYGCARRTRCPTSTECHGMPWDFAWPEVLARLVLGFCPPGLESSRPTSH